MPVAQQHSTTGLFRALDANHTIALRWIDCGLNASAMDPDTRPTAGTEGQDAQWVLAMGYCSHVAWRLSRGRRLDRVTCYVAIGRRLVLWYNVARKEA